MKSGFDPGLCASLCQSRKLALGTRVHFAHETESTNDDAGAALRDGAAHGEVFVAASQSKGRGRRGDSWFSPPGDNLLFSTIVRANIPAPRWGMLPLVVGLAVRQASEQHGAPHPMLKWPNDVWIDGKKLAGILVESQFRKTQTPAFVLGVGVNLLSRSFPPELRTTATSLALLVSDQPCFEQLLVDILTELEARLALLLHDDLEPLRRELARYDALHGKVVTIGTIRGVAQGIDDDGALLVAQPNSSVQRVLSGSVSVA